MGVRSMLGVGLLVLCTACGASRSAVVAETAAANSRRYVDEDLGFEIVRPSTEWQLDETNERTPEGLAIPVVLRHRDTGAQVVLQVAPAVATPSQFAERLTEGLRQQPGFVTSDPQPIPLSDTAVGFDFQAGTGVRGRVAVREGSPGHVLMMLATWPISAPDEVPRSVDALFEGVKPLRVPEQG
ncbi:hypothetical protein P2318_11760 [Myxococcaceae bacterium GXIMD 01537]